MKPTLLLPPLAALLAGGLWAGSQHRTLTRLQTETEVLREYIAAAHQAQAAAGDAQKDAAVHRGKDTAAQKPIDWKKVLEASRDHNDVVDMRLEMEMQKRMMAMSADDLLKEAEAIEAMDLPAADKVQLEMMLVDALSQKDPELALKKFSKYLGDERASWRLASAFQRWAKKDVTAAMKWLDQQTEAGNFEGKSLDGRNNSRSQFESSLIANLLTVNSAEARRRMLEMTDDERHQIFNMLQFKSKAGSEKEMAELIRATAKAGSAPETIASSLDFRHGFDRVDAQIQAISATPEEITAIADRAANEQTRDIFGSGKVNTQKLDELRAWIGKTDPAHAPAEIGQLLSTGVSMGSSFQQQADLAVKFSQEPGNEGVLTHFLTAQASQRPDEVTAMAEKISDPARRQEVLNTVETLRSLNRGDDETSPELQQRVKAIEDQINSQKGGQ